jgi:hypothetical protein
MMQASQGKRKQVFTMKKQLPLPGPFWQRIMFHLICGRMMNGAVSSFLMEVRFYSTQPTSKKVAELLRARYKRLRFS